MGLKGGSEVKAEFRELAPNACKVVCLTPEFVEGLKIEVVIVDFETVFYPVLSSVNNITEVEESALKIVAEISNTYGCAGELHMLFEGINVPTIKQILWAERKKKAKKFSEATLEQHKTALDTMFTMTNTEAYELAIAMLGDEVDHDRKPVTDMMSRLMNNRERRTAIRRFWITSLQENAYRRSPFALVELVDAPYTRLAPPKVFSNEFDTTKRRRIEVDDLMPTNIKVGTHCYISWDHNGSRNRSVTEVPSEKTGEGEAKIAEVVLRCYHEGKKSVMVRSRDTDALVYILMLMRDLVDPKTGEIGITVYLDMGPVSMSERGVLIIDMSQLYAVLLTHLTKKYPYMHNPVETWLTSRVMAGCDYLTSPKGWGIKRLMAAFEGVGHIILAHAVTCSSKVSDPENGFIKLDEERFIVYMRLIASVNWPNMLRKYADPEAAAGKQEVQDEMNNRNFRTMPKKKPEADAVLGQRLLAMVDKGLEDVKDEVGCFDDLVLQMFDACPSQGDLIAQSVAKRNKSKAKDESRKPDLAWTDNQIRAFVRRLCYVMTYFRHSPYGWQEDPLAIDPQTERSKWGWQRDESSGEICISDLV